MPKTAEPKVFRKPKEGFSIVIITGCKTTTGNYGTQEEVDFESKSETVDGNNPLTGKLWIPHNNRKTQDSALQAGLIRATHLDNEGVYDEWEVVIGAVVGIYVVDGKIKSYTAI